jgi:signal-transduction protein with cAMP-binding, CBS, and nucleotidyltransferase domain
MLVKDILQSHSRQILTVRPSTTVQNASRLLSKHNVGALIISADGRRPDGIFTERDLARGIGKRGAEFLRVKVSQVNLSKVTTCEPAEDIYRVMQKMKTLNCRHMPVTSKGVLIGMVSLVDILRELMVKREPN